MMGSNPFPGLPPTGVWERAVAGVVECLVGEGLPVDPVEGVVDPPLAGMPDPLFVPGLDT